MKILIAFFMFFLLSALLIISNENLDLSHEEDLAIFQGKYTEWLEVVFDNFQSITGDVTRMNWAPVR